MANQNKILIAEVTARAGAAVAVRETLAAYGRLVRKEPGNRSFICHQTEADPEKFVVYEVYENEAAFQAHLSDPENAKANAALAPLIAGDGSVLTFLHPFE